MLFESSKPVSGSSFFNRTKELYELIESTKGLKQGSTKYLALLGNRKTGKTSLLREFMEKINDKNLTCFDIDCWEKKLQPKSFFQDYLIFVIEAFLRAHYIEKFHSSLRASLHNEIAFLNLLTEIRSLKINALNEASEILLEIRNRKLSDFVFSSIIDFPEKLAQETDTYFIVLIDEFQELAELNHFNAIKEILGDIFLFLRSHWQKHLRINYIISGSKLSLMKQILTHENAPFFQHFKILEISDFEETDARNMLQILSQRAENSIPPEMINNLLNLAGTNPFYLQVLGAEICSGKIDDNYYKIVIQNTLFNPMGRLYLYFQDLYDRIVGRSVSLEQTLITIAMHPGTLTSIARLMGIGTGTLKSWINRVQDFIATQNGIYYISDKCFKLWLQNKSDLKSALPAMVLGNEAEKAVAQKLAQIGFDLIYESRASRGAFDLLAIFHSKEAGIQVKKGKFPYYLKTDQLRLMQYWAGKMNWKPVLALVVDENVYFYDLRTWVRNGKSHRIDKNTDQIRNLLEFMQSS